MVPVLHARKAGEGINRLIRKVNPLGNYVTANRFGAIFLVQFEPSIALVTVTPVLKVINKRRIYA